MNNEDVTKMLMFQKRCKGYASRHLCNKQDRQDFISFCMEAFLISPKVILSQDKWLMANYLRKHPISIVRRNFRNKKNIIEESKYFYHLPTIGGKKYIGIDNIYENMASNPTARLEVESIIKKYTGIDRALFILHKQYRFNHRELSKIFGIHLAAISLILKRLSYDKTKM